MGKNKNKERSLASYERESRGFDLRKGHRDKHICLSFKDFDYTQGQDFDEWEKEELLAKANRKLVAICQLTVKEATAKQVIKEYPQFPPKAVTAFYHPKHIPLDVTWCSCHIQGKECVIGYFIENIFHVVFLDKDHEFWISTLKNT